MESAVRTRPVARGLKGSPTGFQVWTGVYFLTSPQGSGRAIARIVMA